MNAGTKVASEGWVLGICALLACTHQNPARKSDCIPYAPKSVELEGILTRVEKFGAPSYGEHPETDEKLEILLLELPNPISVCPGKTGEVLADTLKGISEIQLILVDQSPAYDALIHRKVHAIGVVEEGMLGSQFTPVVMTVKSLTRLP